MAIDRQEQRRLYLEAQVALSNFERACREPNAVTDEGRAKIFATMKSMQNACNKFTDYGIATWVGDKTLIE